MQHAQVKSDDSDRRLRLLGQDKAGMGRGVHDSSPLLQVFAGLPVEHTIST